MEEKRTSIFENGLIWFGAGVSIAEILTGTYLRRWDLKEDWRLSSLAISLDASCCFWRA